MMQVGEKAQTAAQGAANPACGSRGMSCDFAVLHAYTVRRSWKHFEDLAHVAILDMRVTIMQECCPVP